MEAKEKAEELVLKFLRVENNTPEWFNTHIAKQCALIAVEEILQELENIDDGQTVIPYDYWQQVKTEINNL
jgi:hypothetical protein